MARPVRHLPLLATLALSLLCAAPAYATAPLQIKPNGSGGGQIVYTAAPGENNHVTVTQSGNDVTFSDPGAVAFSYAIVGTPVTPCTQPNATAVTCTVAPGWVLGIDLGDGNDSLDVQAALGTEAFGGDGNDTLSGGPIADMLGGDAGNDVVRGGGGNDILGGGDGNDELYGDMGNDVMRGDAGSDDLFGGDGIDSADYQTSLLPVSVTPDGVADDGALNEDDDVATDVESATGGTAGDDLTAGSGGGTLTGGQGDDILRGGPAADTLIGGDGDDTIFAGADTVADGVTCGAGTDSVDADTLDTVAGDCETITLPHPADPAAGPPVVPDPPAPLAPAPAPVAPASPDAVNGKVAHGKVLISVGGGTPHELAPDEPIPAGAIIDTRQGSVTLTAAPDAKGNVQSATFNGARFRVRRTRDPLPITELELAGPMPACPRAGAAVAAARRPPAKRSLWGSGHGRFRTRGRYAAATVRGTIWLTEDRCDGTVVAVKRGLVSVRDTVRKRTVMVKAGARYLARKR